MTLLELWTWALVQSDCRANTVAPLQITKLTDPEDEHGHRDPKTVIGGRPFTNAFVTYVQDEEVAAPIEKALSCLQTDPRQHLEFEICWAILHGGHADPEVLRGILGCSDDMFRFAALRGLTFLRERADEYLRKELSRIDERVQTAGDMHENQRKQREEELYASRPLGKRARR